MPRFVRIYNQSHVDPGARLRVDYDPDDTYAFVLADETTLPEHVYNVNARNVKTIANVSLDHNTVRWLRDTLSELLVQLDEEEQA
jgi:hypothetical protein